MKKNNTLEKCFNERTRAAICNIGFEKLYDYDEIRLRVDKPIILKKGSKEYCLDKIGEIDDTNYCKTITTRFDIDSTISLISGYSLYAYEEELKNGFITIEGGHRVGICGKAVIENGCVKTIKNISSINIRIAKEIKDCARPLMKYIIEGNKVYNTCILSLPCIGKTTVLRDVIRLLGGDGYKKTVGVVDERGEIAACYNGDAQNDIGLRTDVLDGCPKAAGMLMLVRTMSPEVVAVDEIGKKEDMLAIKEAISTGVSVICTVHAENVFDLKIRPEMANIIEEGIFERYIAISMEKEKRCFEIYDGAGRLIAALNKGG